MVQKRHLSIIQTKQKYPHNIAYYRPIAIMNGILKLWTSILTNTGSPWAEAHSILSDTSDGLRRHTKIYDSRRASVAAPDRESEELVKYGETTRSSPTSPWCALVSSLDPGPARRMQEAKRGAQ